MWLSSALAIASAMSYEPATIATLRRALDEVIRDNRFRHRKSASALEIAEHLLALAAAGERDLERMKASAFRKLTANAERIPSQAA
jgi:UDP:flavonoid glycosyltransferase YjiC (YdhE family)